MRSAANGCQQDAYYIMQHARVVCALQSSSLFLGLYINYIIPLIGGAAPPQGCSHEIKLILEDFLKIVCIPQYYYLPCGIYSTNSF